MPTRRSSRHRNAAFEAHAAGATAILSTPDPATVETSSNVRSSSNADSASTESASTDSAIALVAAAPLSRRAARERRAADVVIETPDEPFIAAASEQIIADVPAAPVDVLVEVADPTVTSAAATSHAAEPVVSVRDAESALPVDDEGDAFERASRAFRTTGAVPTVATERPASVTPEQDAPTEGILSAHVASGRPRRLRKAVTLGATVGVMGIAGLLAVGMTLPAEAVAAVQGAKAAATSLVSASAAEKSGMSSDEIQAFVAPAGVENESLARADDFSTVSLVQVAEEQGINYSGEVFTNDPDAAIQWPFLVGVGMSYGYGMRSGRLHEGIDFVPGNGAPIQAIADGTVRIATEQGGAYGVTVYIDHVIDGAVITSHYSHMQYGSLQVKAGDTVKVGTIVGKTGNTGRSYGAHLHFELIVNGSTIDPLPWLRENAGRTSY